MPGGAARSPWLLVLNPDVELPPGFLRQVFARIDHHESHPDGAAGIVGFGLLNPDGSPQGSVGNFPTLLRSVREQFLPASRRKYRPARRVRPGAVNWVTGACMLVNVDLLEQVGGLDEDFFLYHEEVALCREARRRGWRIAFDPAASVVHRHPLQNRPISPKMRVITRHSKLLYFHKHLPRWQFRTLVAIVRGEALVRGVVATLAGRPEEARAWRVIGEMARRDEDGAVAAGPRRCWRSPTRSHEGRRARGRGGRRDRHDRVGARHGGIGGRAAAVATLLGPRKDGPA